MKLNSKERPEIFVGWVHRGRGYFEVIPKSQFESLLTKLQEKGVHPGTIFISKMTFVHWICDEFHKGFTDVSVYKFYEQLKEINDPKAYYKPPKLESKPTEKDNSPNYGYVSPNGRYFKCKYSGHSSLAKDIVGEVIDASDPQKYLEDNGWICIYHDPFNRGTYSISIGAKHKMTDKQLKTLQYLQIPTNCDGFEEALVGREY